MKSNNKSSIEGLDECQRREQVHSQDATSAGVAKVLARGPEVAREPVFLWPAEGFPNVKGCGPRKCATEVFFQN